jgi:predicted XRE-type DNA-binding protein
MKRKQTDIHYSRTNLFADLGFENPDEELMRAKLAARVDKLLSNLGGTQKELARTLGLGQSEISDLVRGRYGRFSIERLLRILTRLGCKIEVSVSAPTPRRRTGRMIVKAA